MALESALFMAEHNFERVELPLFLFAIAVTAWYGGTGPAILALVLSSFAFDYYFTAPLHSLRVTRSEVPYYLVYILFASLVAGFSATRRRVESELLRTRDELQDANKEALRRNEAYLTEAQKLSHTGSFGWNVSTGEIFWSEETYRIFGLDKNIRPTMEFVFQRIHPDDRGTVQRAIDRAIEENIDFNIEHRVLMPDGEVKYILALSRPSRPSPGVLEYLGAVTDVTGRKRAEEALRRSEAYLAEGQKLSWTGTWACNIATREMIHSSQEHRHLFGLASDTVAIPPLEDFFQRIHPDDRGPTAEELDRAISAGRDVEANFRIVLPEGATRYMHGIGRPLIKPSGDTGEYVGAVTDVTAAKQAEMKLQESEAYLAEAQRLSRTGSWAWNPATNENRYWSDECFRLLGFDPAEGMPPREAFLQRIHPEDRTIVAEKLERATRERGEYEADYRIVHPGGEIRDIHAVGHPVLGPSGDLVELVGTAIDVTERKQAEDKIRQSEAYLAEAQRLSHTGSWAWSPATGENRYWSDECFRLLGFDPAHGMPPFETFLQRIHPEDLPIVAEKLERAVRERGEYEADYRIIHPNGEVRDIHAIGHPVLGPSGDLIELVGSAIDVTERKRAEDNLRQSENELRHILDFAPQQVAVLGPDYSRIYINQAALDYFGITLEESRDLDRRSFFHPDDYERLMVETQAKFLSGAPHEAEYRLRRKDGTYRWFLFRYNPLRDEQGRLRRWYTAGTDIEDRKEAEELSRRAQADLAHVNRVTTMGELTASVAHEVNQPIAASLTNAKTCLRWLAGDTPNLEEAREAARRIVQDQTRAAEIISRIRLLFKKDTSRRELVDMNEIIREMIVLLRGEATRYLISLRTELTADLPRVMGDRVQLQQVMMNLMMNGIDAMAGVGGMRELIIGSQRAEDGQVAVSVSDTGVGLPPERAGRIFDAFFTTKPQGTGMGLRISLSIVESHGGRLWASEAVPCGARFCFTLPTAQART
jgi:PAS domain S-box-containing protein